MCAGVLGGNIWGSRRRQLPLGYHRKTPTTQDTRSANNMTHLSHREEERQGSHQTDRRAFLGTAAAALVAAGSSLESASASEVSDSGARRFVVLLEGRFIRQEADGEVEMEVMHSVRVRVRGKDFALANQVQDPESGRTFVRILVREGADIEAHADNELIRWSPRMVDNVMALEVPLVFASRSGVAASVNEASFSLADMTKVEVPGPQGAIETILLPPFLPMAMDETTTADTTRTRCLPLLYLDDTQGDIGHKDDEVRRRRRNGDELGGGA